jgi:hypothetical protein
VEHGRQTRTSCLSMPSLFWAWPSGPTSHSTSPEGAALHSRLFRVFFSSFICGIFSFSHSNATPVFTALHRSPKQCRERWANHLDPGIRKDPFTAEEDARIIELYKVHGTKWARIRKEFPGRTYNGIKNRFYYHLLHKRRTAVADSGAS